MRARAAFTLVEMLAVMGIIVVLIGLAVPAVNSMRASTDITTSAYTVSGVFEQARAYAMANNTYVWVGFFEEDGSKPSDPTKAAVAGVGRVIISVVASRDGTRYLDTGITDTTPVAFDPQPDPTQHDPSNRVILVQLGKLLKLESAHLTAANLGRGAAASSNTPPRPPVDAAYQVGDATVQTSTSNSPFATRTTAAGATEANPTTFNYPLSTKGPGNGQYTFTKIIEFNPQGEASKIVDSLINGPQAWVEIALVPTHGNAVDARYSGTASAAAVQLSGLSGRIRIFRP